jgi:hypothetical protein
MHTIRGGRDRSLRQFASHVQARQLQIGLKIIIYTSTTNHRFQHTIPEMVDAPQPSTYVFLVDPLLNPSSLWLWIMTPRQTTVRLLLPYHSQQQLHQQLPAAAGIELTGRDSTPESSQPTWISHNCKERMIRCEPSPTLHGLYTKLSMMLFH